MRILIIGAGVGGMTLATLLAHGRAETTLIERASNLDHAGYMLGLWPLGYRILHGLGLYERFAAECITGDNYEVRDDCGRLVKRWSMESVTKRFGPNLSCTRPQLVKLLQAGLGDTPIQFNTSIESLRPSGEQVEARFNDGCGEKFDLVVGADGMGSTTRQLLFGDPSGFDSGWGGWVWWARLADVPPRTFVEHWGAGRFVGAYPTPDGAGTFAGCPIDASSFNEPI